MSDEILLRLKAVADTIRNRSDAEICTLYQQALIGAEVQRETARPRQSGVSATNAPAEAPRVRAPRPPRVRPLPSSPDEDVDVVATYVAAAAQATGGPIPARAIMSAFFSASTPWPETRTRAALVQAVARGRVVQEGIKKGALYRAP